jgi:hypothetical protein
MKNTDFEKIADAIIIELCRENLLRKVHPIIWEGEDDEAHIEAVVYDSEFSKTQIQESIIDGLKNSEHLMIEDITITDVNFNAA